MSATTRTPASIAAEILPAHAGFAFEAHVDPACGEGVIVTGPLGEGGPTEEEYAANDALVAAGLYLDADAAVEGLEGQFRGFYRLARNAR